MTDEDLSAQVLQAARAQGLNLDPASLAAVVANLAVLRGMAAQFVDLPLDDHLDPAAMLRL